MPNINEESKNLEPSFGEFVIVDKTYEPLQVAQEAYNGRITRFTEILNKRKEYPNPGEEKKRLVVHQQLVWYTQTMLEGPPPILKHGSISQKPSLDIILEVSSKGFKRVTVAVVYNYFNLLFL